MLLLLLSAPLLTVWLCTLAAARRAPLKPIDNTATAGKQTRFVCAFSEEHFWTALAAQCDAILSAWDEGDGSHSTVAALKHADAHGLSWRTTAERQPDEEAGKELAGTILSRVVQWEDHASWPCTELRLDWGAAPHAVEMATLIALERLGFTLTW